MLVVLQAKAWSFGLHLHVKLQLLLGYLFTTGKNRALLDVEQVGVNQQKENLTVSDGHLKKGVKTDGWFLFAIKKKF